MPTVVTVSSISNTTPAVVFSDGAHGLLTNTSVLIAGSGGTSIAGTYVITVVDSTHFSLNGSTAGGTGTGGTATVLGNPGFSGAIITNATNATPIVVTTSAAHGMATGDQAQIASVGGNTAANGLWFITKTSSTAFSLDNSVGNSAYTSGGTVTFVRYAGIAGTSITPDAIYIKEFSTTTGTGMVTLAGAVTDYAPFASLPFGAEIIKYRIAAVNGSGIETGDFEEGSGAYSRSALTLTRDYIAKTSTSETNYFPSTFSFSSGTKHVSAIAYNTLATDGSKPATSPVIAPAAGTLTLRNMRGRIQIVDRIAQQDADRIGTNSTVTLVPLPDATAPTGPAGPEVPGSIDLYCVNVAAFGGGRLASGWRQFPLRVVTKSGLLITGTSPIQCSLNAASTHPFTVDPALAISQTTTTARIPADIFVWVPMGGRTGPWPRPRLFYLNWASATSRTGLTEGMSVTGHNISIQDGALSLESAVGGWIAGMADANESQSGGTARFLYLGTVCGLQTNGQADCVARKRLVWNFYNRLAYADSLQISPAGGAVGWWEGYTAGTWQRMQAARGAYDTTWNHFYVNGNTDANEATLPAAQRYKDDSKYPVFYAKTTKYGNVAISIDSDIAGSRTWVLPDGNPAGTTQPGIGDSNYNEYVLEEATIHPEADEVRGFHWVGVVQRGDNSGNRSTIRTCRFFMTGATLGVGAEGIRFAGDVATAGQCESEAQGYC